MKDIAVNTPSVNESTVIDIENPEARSDRLVGTKASHLASLEEQGFPTPHGFVATTALYRSSVEAAHIGGQLDQIWEAAQTSQPARLRELSRKARRLISELHISSEHALEITRRTEAFGSNIDLAVRSSVPAIAVSGPDCAGVHASFTNVVGPDQVMSRIRGCWASLFSERALTMRRRGLGEAAPSIAVIVQPMIAAEKSGLAVPIHDTSDVLIEATFGLGEPVFSGAVEPDRYVIDTGSFTARSIEIGRKQIILPADGGGGHAFAPLDRQLDQVLLDAETVTVASVCTQIAERLGAPHEIEWAFDASGFVVLQARPIAAIRGLANPPAEHMLSGIGIGAGTASGPVRVVRSVEGFAAVRAGDVVVATETTPEWRPHLVRSAAIITDGGDEYSHAARVAREHGIPAVVAAGTATTDLTTGIVVTVDAQRGWIFPAPHLL